MADTPVLWASGTPTTSGTTWTNTTNATGANNGTFATRTTSSSGSVGWIALAGYGAQTAIGAQPLSVDSAIVTVYGYVSNVGRWTSMQVGVFSGATQIGTSQTMTLSTTTTNSQTFTFTGITWADLADLRVRVIGTKSGTQSATMNVDAASVMITYTRPSYSGTGTLSAEGTFSAEGVMSVIATGIQRFAVGAITAVRVMLGNTLVWESSVPEPTVVFFDDFNRANGAIGGNWKDKFGQTSPAIISNNAATVSNWDDTGLVDIGMSEGYRLSAVINQREWPMLYFRFVDVNNYYIIPWSNPEIELIRKLNNSDTFLDTDPSPTLTNMTVWVEVREEGGGTDITWGYNDTTISTIRDTTSGRPAGTKVGFLLQPNKTVDDFTVTTLGPLAIAPTITTTSLTVLAQDTAFSQTLSATGTTPITWTVTAGTLPAGLSLSTAGVLSGTPIGSGAYDFTVTATNSVGTDTQQYTGTITAAGAVIIFEDDFNRADGAMGNGWGYQNFAPTISGNRVTSADWEARALRDISLTTGYRVEVVMSAREWPSLLIRWNDSWFGYYAVAWSNPSIELVRRLDGNTVVLDSMPSPSGTDLLVWCEVREVAGGTEFTWGYGTTSSIYTDNTAGRSMGTSVGFQSHPGRYFDDFKIIEL